MGLLDRPSLSGTVGLCAESRGPLRDEGELSS